eukprot:1158024-Pelagomonas_calceolata.AAC.5
MSSTHETQVEHSLARSGQGPQCFHSAVLVGGSSNIAMLSRNQLLLMPFSGDLGGGGLAWRVAVESRRRVRVSRSMTGNPPNPH